MNISDIFNTGQPAHRKMSDVVLPKLSFLIPMKNEAMYIERCIRSLLIQDYPNIEIWVFDGGSTDDSKQIVDQLIHSRKNCHCLDNPKQIQSAAWNLGIHHATGDIISIVSAHAELAPDYASKVIDTLQRTGADMVGGPTFADAEGKVAQAIALAMNSPFGVGGASFHYTTQEIEVDTVFMGACWRKVYEKIGGFDEEMVRNQDDELSYRLRETGGRIVCNPAIKSRYFNRSTLKGLWRQYFQYGYWKIRVLQKHPRQMRPRQFVPPTFVAALLSSFSAFLFLQLAIPGSSSPLAILPFLLICGAYLIANFAASIYLATKKGWQELLFLPLIFPILHISYGLGFLIGLIKFWNRWRDKTGQVPTFILEKAIAQNPS